MLFRRRLEKSPKDEGRKKETEKPYLEMKKERCCWRRREVLMIFFLGAVHGGVGENEGSTTSFLLNWSGSQFEFHKHASNSNWIQTLDLGILILIKDFFLICGVLHIGFLWFFSFLNGSYLEVSLQLKWLTFTSLTTRYQTNSDRFTSMVKVS